jgi:hypothetical protein
MRTGRYARAFTCPRSDLAKLELLWRGWRPFDLGQWWHKPSRNQAAIEKGPR